MNREKGSVSGWALGRLLGVLLSVWGASGLHSQALGSGSIARTDGIGVILGEPSGLTAKFWTENDRAMDAGLAFSFDHFVLMYADYLFHFKPYQTVKPYLGVGGGLLIANNGKGNKYFNDSKNSIGLGLRIPVGAEWFVPSAPFGIFLELVPGLGIIPSTYGFFQGGIGARFYFK